MMLWGLGAIMMSSLFFSTQECRDIENLEHSNIAENPTEKEDMPLVLNGILCRPDLNHWIVWINGVRIYSQRPQSIQGWTIVKVHSDSVVVRSKNGEERELRPEQDPDLEEFNTSMDDNTPEDLEVNEDDQNDGGNEESAGVPETENSENSGLIPEASKHFENNLMPNTLTSQGPNASP
jgi:hypothetical protein